jgi:hypothetical protein
MKGFYRKDYTVTHELQNRSSSIKLAELGELLGPPPVLSTENAKAYDEVLARLMQCLAPRDFMEQILIKQLTDCTWEMMRYTRHKTLAIEHKVRQRLEFQAQRAKAAAQNRDAQARGLAESDHEPATELGRMSKLEDMVENVVHDVDAILLKPPVELDHVRALEAAIAYHGKLDQLLNAAVARRNDVLEQFERYRHGWGKRLRKASDEIIDAEFNDAEPEPKEVAAPLAPSIEGSK